MISANNSLLKTMDSSMFATSSLLNLFHFNDVYDIQPDYKQPKAGVAAFKTLLDRYKSRFSNHLTMFSGDAFAPSLLSASFEGRNMVKPLNALGIDLACFGNHDFDYKLEHVIKLKESTNFPWLLSNIYDKRTEKRLAGGEQFRVFEVGSEGQHEDQKSNNSKQQRKVRVGVFSLAEKEWIDVLYPWYHDICEYVPFIDVANYLVQVLKNDHNCDIIIALTHMMKYNDIKLAEAVPQIDLILGGHDHSIVHQKINNSLMVKSGTNFRNFSIVSVHPKEEYQKLTKLIKEKDERVVTVTKNERWCFVVRLLQVNHQKEDITPNEDLKEYVDSIYKEFSEKQNRIALYTKTPIDLRFSIIRKQPSSILEFIAEFYRHYTRADCMFLNSGNFRADTLINEGSITFGILTNIIEDELVVKLTTGKDIIIALEHMVSMYPNNSGRMCALQGIQMTWDPIRPPYSRILASTVKINSLSLCLEKTYRVCLHKFTSNGGDGFQVFKNLPLAQDIPETKNIILLRELSDPESQIVQDFRKKHPNLLSLIEKEGKKFFQLNLPEAKNVLMSLTANQDL